jgi:hypothetical protein
MEQLASQYIDALTQEQVDGDRKYFLPLGELEIDALCRLYNIRLQVIKTEALDHILEGQARHAPPIAEVDQLALDHKVLPVLNKIKEDVTPWESAREAIDTVLLFVTNILDNPGEEKYKTLKKSNTALQRRVLAKKGGEALLHNLGFVEQAKKILKRQ